MPHTHAHNLSICSLTLICLCINIRGVGMGVWGGVCLLISPPIPFRSGLRQTVCCVDTELTHMPPHGRPPTQTECVALRRPLEIFSERMEDSGTIAAPAGKKNKVPSEVKKHKCVSELLCSQVGILHHPGKHPKVRHSYSRSSQCRRRQNNVDNRGNKKETAYSFMALSCVDLICF